MKFWVGWKGRKDREKGGARTATDDYLPGIT